MTEIGKAVAGEVLESRRSHPIPRVAWANNEKADWRMFTRFVGATPPQLGSSSKSLAAVATSAKRIVIDAASALRDAPSTKLASPAPGPRRTHRATVNKTLNPGASGRRSTATASVETATAMPESSLAGLRS
jgi:hypothetical protein